MSPPVLRAGSPDDLALLVPHLLGFHPTASLVLACLHEGRVGTVMRVDLPVPGDEEALAAYCADVVADQGADAAFAFCFADTSETDPVAACRPLAEAVRSALPERGVAVSELGVVSSGRRWSYLCAAGCCPASGSDLALLTGGVSAEVEAAHAYLGRATLSDRAALAASVRPLPGVGEPDARSPARSRAEQRVATTPRAELADTVCRLVRAAVSGPAAPGRLQEDDAWLLVLALRDVLVRDLALTLVLDVVGHDDATARLMAVFVALAQSAPDPCAAPVCTLLAVAAYCLGDGSLANVALDRAEDCEPGYSLAVLVRTLLDRCTSPDRVREVLEGVRVDLRGAVGVAGPAAGQVRSRRSRPNRPRQTRTGSGEDVA